MGAPVFVRLRQNTLVEAARLLLVVLVGLSASRFLTGATLWSTLDGPTHTYRLFELERTLGNGHLFPRWAPDFVYDYGYPLFNFYAPLLYYVGEGLRLVLGTSYLGTLELLVALSLALSGVSMYLLAREMLGATAALLAAVAYVYWPYRMAVVYVRGDVPEILSYSLLPLVLFACYRWLAKSGRQRDLILAGATYAAVILTHNLTAFYFTPLLLLFCGGLLVRERGRRRERLPGLAIALGAALAVTAFFWLPALLETQWLHRQRLFAVDYAASMTSLPALFQPVSWRYYYYPDTRNLETVFPFGFASLVALLPGLAALIVGRGIRGVPRLALGLLALIALAAVLGMWNVLTPLSGPLGLMQFSYRLLGFAPLGTAPLVGAAYLLLPMGRGRRRALRGAALVLMAGLLVLSSSDRLQPMPSPGGASMDLADFHAHEYAGRSVGTTWVGEFVPRWVAYDPFELGYRQPLPADEMVGQAVTPLANAPSVQVLEWDGLRRRVRVSATEDWTLTWHTLYFPGWEAHLDGERVALIPTTPLGLAGVAVPKGEHEVELRLGLTGHQQAGTGLSLLALAAIVLAGGIRAVRGAVVHGGVGRATLASFTMLAVIGVALGITAPNGDSWTRLPAAGRDRGLAIGTSPVGGGGAATFGDSALLADYRWQGGPLKPGGSFAVDLFWLGLRPIAEDDAVFVHLTDQDGRLWAQHDSRPVYGYTPTTRWAPGELLHDRHQLALPESLPDGTYLIKVGVYPAGGASRLEPRIAAGKENGGPRALPERAVLLGKVEAGSRPPAETAAAEAHFGDEVALVAHRLSGAEVSAGGEIRAELVWQALRRPTRDYTVFLHLLGPDGLVAQVDRPPREGRYPTALWDEGELVGDSFALRVPGDTAPGKYRLVAGLYEVQTMRRLPVRPTAPAGPRDAVDLGEIAVR